MSEEKKTIVLICQGGAGDIIAQTSMVRAMKTKYPDDNIIVVSTYSWVWENNKNVSEVIPFSELRDFYSEYILKKNVRFVKKRFMYDYLFDDWGAENKCLLEFACKCYQVEYDGQGVDYFISEKEQRAMQTFMTQTDKKKVLLHIMGATPSDGAAYQKLICGICGGNGVGPDRNKCQACGGSGFILRKTQTNALKDLKPAILEPIIKKHVKTIDFLQFGLEGEPLVPGAVDCLGMPAREAIACIPFCDSFIFIESLFAHAAAAIKPPKSGVVVFQNMSPEFFGYKNNFNVWDTGGCAKWPCNRPIFFDQLPGYLDPKTRAPVGWRCKGQPCAKISTEKLEKVLLESLEKNEKAKTVGPHKTLEEARKA